MLILNLGTRDFRRYSRCNFNSSNIQIGEKKLFNASKEFHISDYFHLVIFWNALRIVFPSMLKRAVITPIFKKDHSLIVVVVVVGLLCNSTGDKVPKCSTS